MEYMEWRTGLQTKVLETLDYTQELKDEDVLAAISKVLMEDAASRWMPLKQIRQARDEIFCSLRRLDVLQTFIDDPTITEIMVNGPEHIYIERDGTVQKAECRFENKERLQDVIQQIVAGCNRAVNESAPIVDARLPDGSRVNVVMEPVALNGPIVTIRRFPDVPITMEELIAQGCITEEAAAFLEKLVMAKYNILISGGTGSGKTTFLNVLSGFIGNGERVVTIEDSAELQLQGLENWVSLETRNKNAEGCQEISIRDLIRASLRMRPDRIIVGEVRGAETVDMLSAYGFFTPLPDCWENIPTYTQETNGASTAYGLEIYSPGCLNRFSTFCTGDQTYYVFLSKESVNLAGLNGNGAPTDDAALQVLNYLLEETNGPGKEN